MAARAIFSRLRRLNLGVRTRFAKTDSPPACSRYPNKSFTKTKIVGFMTAAAAVSATPESKKLEKVDPSKLTSSYLLRNAAAANVDTALTLFNQTVSTFLEIHEKYVEGINSLLSLQDVLVNSFDIPSQEERVWDAMLAVRKRVNDYKATLTELEFLYASTDRLVNNASEAAYLAGAEFASSIASERLHAAQLRINAANDQTRSLELSLAKKEAWVIQETAKHAEKEKDEASAPGHQSSTSDESVAVRSETIQGKEAQTDSEFPSVISEDSVSSKDSWFDVIFDQSNAKHETAQRDLYDKEEEPEDERKWANT